MSDPHPPRCDRCGRGLEPVPIARGHFRAWRCPACRPDELGAYTQARREAARKEDKR